METFLEYKFLIGAAVLAALLVAERLRPVAPRPPGAGRLVSNVSLAGLNGMMSPVFTVPVTVFAATQAPDWRPDMLHGALGLAIDLLLLDLWIYWWHRLNHRVGFLWRFHEVHHLDEFLDVTTSLRFHFGEVILSTLVRASFIFVLDIGWTSVLVFELLVQLTSGFHHSNVALPPRLEAALRQVIVTPSHHWVHHHNIRQDTDSNYATILTVWDRIFRSWSPTRRWPDMPIGTEGRAEKPLPGLLARPLQLP